MHAQSTFNDNRLLKAITFDLSEASGPAPLVSSPVDMPGLPASCKPQPSSRFLASGANKNNGDPSALDIENGNFLGGPAQDGPPVQVNWYCGNCGDGPIPDWQSGCPSCNHVQCGCCSTETS